MKRNEPLWKRKLAKKMLADQRLWDKLKGNKYQNGWVGDIRFEAGFVMPPLTVTRVNTDNYDNG